MMDNSVTMDKEFNERNNYNYRKW